MRCFASGFLTLLLAGAPAYAMTICPSSPETYQTALCAYHRGDFVAAESLFQQIADVNEQNPTTMRAVYFLARTQLKLKKFDSASRLLIWIYTQDPAFYKEWACDYLLGEARKGVDTQASGGMEP